MKKLPQSIRERLIEFMRSPGYRPQKDHHLAEAVGLSVRDRPAFRTLLKELDREGLIAKRKGNRWDVSRVSPRISGRLFLSPRGHGFVRPEEMRDAVPEIYISPDGVNGALHGDLVRVEIVRSAEDRARRRAPADRPDTKAEGRIVEILDRGKKVAVGLFMQSSMYSYVIPDNPRMQQNIYIEKLDREMKKALSSGRHKVVVKLNPSPLGERLTGTVMEDLGDPDAPGTDVRSILREHEIPETFSPKTGNEVDLAVQSLENIENLAPEGRKDLRDLLILTIDPSDAKDHDDAVSLDSLPGGRWRLGVHIADVSHFVTPGSAIDRDARERGNSVYMVDRFIPMLPPHLTTAVCSLKPDQDRLAYSVFIDFGTDLEMEQVTMHPSLIRPALLLDYESVQEVIEGRGGGGLTPAITAKLKEMNDLALRLRRQRMGRGALDLSMPEVVCRLDEDGNPVDIHRRTAEEAYHLIEEYMLAANIAVAERIRDADASGIYRVHEEPSDEQWEQMAADLRQLGVAENPGTREDVQRILKRFEGQPLSYPVSVSMLRNFKRAVYSADCTPHFGLAFEAYTHFTSPIRRYSDLVVHRILKGLDSAQGSPYRRKDCERIAEHCSDRERETAEAEEESLLIKRIQYYAIKLGKGDIGPWPALITGGTARGLLVELTETLQRGFVPVHTLPDPNARHERDTGFIVGTKGRQMARVGDVIDVELVRVDSARRMIELRWSHDGQTGGTPEADIKKTSGRKSGSGRRVAAESRKRSQGRKRSQRKR